jgi:hypothetical protein
MSYINQIFGDETIRDIIQEVFPMGGQLVIEPADENFEYSVHHVYYKDEDEEPLSELTEEEQAARPRRHSNGSKMELPSRERRMPA